MLFSRAPASLRSLFILLSTCLAGYVPEGAKCQDYTIPVNVTSLNYPWTAPKWTDNFGFIDFASIATSRTDYDSQSPIGVPVLETAGYSIDATFCTPKGKPNTNAGKVLLASHGLGFDRRYGNAPYPRKCCEVLTYDASYWNSAYKPDEYNFVRYAIQRGYSVFFHDRLGVGNSTKYASNLSFNPRKIAKLSQSIRLQDPTQHSHRGPGGAPHRRSFWTLHHVFGTANVHYPNWAFLRLFYD